MTLPTRRTINQQLLGSLMIYGLIETLFHGNLLADTVKPVIGKWLVELHDLSRSLKDHKLKDLDFQAKMEELYKKVDLAELLTLVDLDLVAKTAKFPEKGAANFGIDLSKVEGSAQAVGLRQADFRHDQKGSLHRAARPRQHVYRFHHPGRRVRRQAL